MTRDIPSRYLHALNWERLAFEGGVRGEMNIKELLFTAREVIDRRLVSSISEAHQVCVAVIDLLSESAPCGLEAPTVIRQRGHGSTDLVRVPASWAADVEAEDARHMARALLRAADSAEGASE